MLETFDARDQVNALRRWFEEEHARQPYSDAYASSARRVFALLASPTDPNREDEALLGVVETLLTVIEEVGLEPTRFLLTENRNQETAEQETASA